MNHRGLRPGDIVGIPLTIVNRRSGQPVNTKVVCRGMVIKLFRSKPNGRWKAEILWENPRLGFLYTGNKDWAYVKHLVFVEAGLPMKVEKRGYTIRYPLENG